MFPNAATEKAEQGARVKEQAVLFLENSPDCTIILDRKWLIVYVNPAFRKRFGCLREPIGTDFLSYLEESSEQHLCGQHAQLFLNPRQVELQMVSSDSNTVPLQYSFFPLPVSGSREVLLAGIGRDRTADITLLNEVVQLNVALENKRKELSEANVRLEQLAITDQITQLYNRHYFFKVAEHFWEESRRYKLPMVAIMIDFDNFKTVNDTYGHIFGDYVLREASARLRTTTRKSDILCRYGGEELALIASNTDMATGLVWAERMRYAVASDPFVMGNYATDVTISIGISGTELGDFPTFEALLDSSDVALYAAKRAGKNCIFSYVDGRAVKR